MRDSINNFIDLLVKGDSFLIFLVIMLVIIIGVIVCLVRLQIGDREYYEDDDEIEDTKSEIREVTEDLVPRNNANKEVPSKEFARFVAPEPEEIAPRMSLKDKMKEYESRNESLLKEEIKEPLKESKVNVDVDEEDDFVTNNNTYELPSRRVVEQSRFNFDADFDKEVEEVIEEEEKEETLVPESNYSYEETSNKVDDLVRSSFDIENSISKISNEVNEESEELSYNNLQSPLEFNGYKKEDYTPSSSFNMTIDSEPAQNVDEMNDYEREQENHAIISARELENKINTMKETGAYEQHQEELRKYEQELENKAIISYDELLKRASDGVVSYESEENVGGISIGKVDTKQIDDVRENGEKTYYKEEAFLEAMKEFRRAL